MGRTEAIKCDHCKKLVEIDSEDYFRIEGNIYIGYTGGVIGGLNLETHESFFCTACFMTIIKNAAGTTSNARNTLSP